MSDWSDTPPTKAGTYWARRRSDGEEQIGTLDGESWYFKWPYEDWFPANNPEQFQFGYRIPTNGEMAQIDRERAALCEVATICMNTRAIMPEFRDISDYTEVVDIIGAFLERLKELPGLIEEYGLRCKAYGLALQSLGSDEQWGIRKMRDELLTKINAILGGGRMTPEQIERVMKLVRKYERSRHLERRALSENRDDAWRGWSAEANRVLAEIRAALTAESEGDE